MTMTTRKIPMNRLQRCTLLPCTICQQHNHTHRANADEKMMLPAPRRRDFKRWDLHISSMIYSSAMAMILHTLIIASSAPVYAYSSSFVTVASHSQCQQPTTLFLKRRHGHDGIRNCIKASGFSGATSIRTRTTNLFSAIDGSLQDASNDEMQSTDFDAESSLDNLLPSTLNINMKAISSKNNARMGFVNGRKANGISSSALLPLSEVSSLEEKKAMQTLNPNENSAINLVTPSSFLATNDNPTEDEGPTSWKDRLVDVSNIASFLCVLDCTLLPLVSIAIPALSWTVGWITGMAGTTSTAAAAAGTTATTNSLMIALSSVMSVIPAIGHGIALYFVIPVGLLTTIVNYIFGHKEIRFSLPALLGVMLIYAANSSHGVGIVSVDAWLGSTGIAAIEVGRQHVHGACGSAVGTAVGHACSEGWAHRMTNTLGCAFLLGSNYASRKYMEESSRGCAASAMAEAWGGEAGGKMVCPPGCNCEQPTYGTSGAISTRTGGEMFFKWERGKGERGKGKTNGSGSGTTFLGPFSRFRR